MNAQVRNGRRAILRGMPRCESQVQAVAVVTADNQEREQRVLIQCELDAGHQGQHEAHNASVDPADPKRLVFQRANWS